MTNLEQVQSYLDSALSDGHISLTEKMQFEKALIEDNITEDTSRDIKRIIGNKILESPKFADAERALKTLWRLYAAVEHALSELQHLRSQRAKYDFALTSARVHFSPGQTCQHEIIKLIAQSKHMLHICVYNLTDWQIGQAIEESHLRGVDVKLITDNQNFSALASKLRENGISVRVDNANLMHHKFAIVDNQYIINGSYNWTHQAKSNDENILIIRLAHIVEDFSKRFDLLWEKYA